MTEILLARHGETDWNIGRRVQGHTDIPLNAAGVEQARGPGRAARRRAADGRVLERPVARAGHREQRSPLVHGLEVNVDPRLREKNFGTWEGLTDVEIAERFPDASARAVG